MEKKFRNSYRLVKESFWLLLQDVEILVFPVFAFLVVCILGFLVFNIFGFTSLSSFPEKGSPTPEFIAAVITVYFLIFFVFTFSNAGVIAATYERLSGNNPTTESSWNVITQNFGRIFLWALSSATVGVVLMILRNRKNRTWNALWGAVEIAWDVLYFVVLPIVVLENCSLKEGKEKAKFLLKKTWGENIIGQFSMGLFFSILWVAISLLFLVIPLLPSFLSIPTLVFMLISYFIVGILMNTLRNIYATALYFYATTGEVPDQYSSELIKDAFVTETNFL